MSQPYELEPIAETPAAPPGVIVKPAPEEALEAAATDLFLHAMNCVRAFGDFNLALSGGRTPVRLYQMLMLDPQYRAFPWSRTHLWVAAEKAQGPDRGSASALLRDLIAQHSGLPREQFHPVDIEAGPNAYARLLRETLGWREPGHDRLDYVLLGLGEAGSTAGLQRITDVDSERLFHAAGDGESAWHGLGIRAINAARLIAVLALGSGKHTAVKRAIGGESRPERKEHPIDHIDPVGGELRWYVDKAALSGAASS
ncbi:MAG: 6-phosphogluconolactonase [Planctomycetota bacterium]